MTNTSSKSSAFLTYVFGVVGFLHGAYAAWIFAFILPATETPMQRMFVGSIVLVVGAIGLMSIMRVLLGDRDIRWPYVAPLGILMVGTGMLLFSIDKVM